MKNLLFLISCFLLTGIYCELPIDPKLNYNNCTIAINNISENQVFFFDDTVDIAIAIELPHLIDSISVSFIGDTTHDTTIDGSFATEMSDTLHLNRLFTTPDSILIALTGYMSNGQNVTASVTIIIRGHEPEIVSNPKILNIIEPGFPCTLTVKAAGSAPLRFQWFKGTDKLAGDTLDTLILTYALPTDSGEYYCEISNLWATKKSTKTSIVVKDASDKKVFWKFGIFKDTLNEGETLFVRIDSMYIAPSAEAVALSFLSTSAKARFIGDSLFVFIAGKRDSGEYYLPVIMAAASGADTGVITVSVLPRYCTLTLKADSGSVSATPHALTYRWGDTVTLNAVPVKDFKFFKWAGDASGTTAELKTTIIKNSTITALFTAESTTGCTELYSGSLNNSIKDASPSKERPGSICPAAGPYDNGTIKVSGTVRFTFQ